MTAERALDGAGNDCIQPPASQAHQGHQGTDAIVPNAVQPYWAGDGVTLYHGHALAVLEKLPDESVDCCVTSPPYYSLRDYGEEGQYGLEDSPHEYVLHMQQVFAEVRRVLADDGTLWLNIGDTYYSGKGNPGPNGHDAKNPARRGWVRPVDRCGQWWGTRKSLLGIPWRVALALVDDGWIWRNTVVWHKPNATPDPVEDRLPGRWEPVLMFAKNPRYWFNRFNRDGADANPGDVWPLRTQPFPDAHYAVMAPALALRCVRAGCKPGGTVLDPFAGTGTTCWAARGIGRHSVGIDLSAASLDLAIRYRLAQGVLAL